MTARRTRKFTLALAGATAALVALAGCVVQQQRPIQRLYAEKATVEVPPDELLDVGVRLFDPNVPDRVNGYVPLAVIRSLHQLGLVGDPQ